MRPLQLKISPPQGGGEKRRNFKTVSERNPRENFQMRPLQLKISPPQGGRVERRNFKTVSERNPPGEFSDASFAAENFSPTRGWREETELE